MRQLATVTHRRNQWKATATQRSDPHRYRRTQRARLQAERAQATQERTETHTRLRQLTSQAQAVAVRPKVDVVGRALHLLWEARISVRAVCRVLTLLASALGITRAPCPHTVLNGISRLAIVRLESARGLRGVPRAQAPCSNGLIWRIDGSMGLGSGTMWALWALDAPHPQLVGAAAALAHVHGLGGAVGASWTGEAIADMLDRLIAQRGRPAASRTDGGSARHTAADVLEARGRGSPCLDDIAHAAAGLLTHSDHHPLACERFVSACGRVSGTRTPTLVACWAPPTVRPTARFMPGHRLCTWAARRLHLSPPGGATTGARFARRRSGMEELPACQDRITRFCAEAQGVLACQKMVKTKGLCHDTLAQGQPLLSALPSAPWRLTCAASLASQRATAKTWGRDHVGWPIRSAAIAALCGVAKRHGVGHTPDAARLALRLPAFCGAPTREEAEQVLESSVSRPHESTGQVTSWTTQRREVLGHRKALERLGRSQGEPPVERIPRPKNRSNHEAIVNLSMSCEDQHGPPLVPQQTPGVIENAGPPDMKEAALRWAIQKPVNGWRPI